MARRAAFLFSTVLPAVLLSGCIHLTVTQIAMPATDVAVRNQQDVTLMAFNVGGKESDHARLTTLVLKSANAANDAYNANNYALRVDTDGDNIVDTTLQEGVSAMNGLITFDNMTDGGLVVAKDQYKRVEVRADIAASLTSTTLQLAIADTVAGYVQGENADDGRTLVGIELNNTCAVEKCEIAVKTGVATNFTLKDSGDLYVTQSNTLAQNRQMLGGTTANYAQSINFRADHEAVDVRSLRFVLTSTSNNISSSVSHLSLFRIGESTPFAQATSGDCATMGGGGGGGGGNSYLYNYCVSMTNGQFVIGKNESANILVRPVINTDTNGGVSGTDITINLNGSGQIGSAVTAIGTTSFNQLAQNDGDNAAEGEIIIGRSTPGANSEIISPKHLVVMSKISSIENADPNADGTVVVSGVDRQIGQFKFRAAENSNSRNGLNKVGIAGIVFTLTSQNVQFDEAQFKVYNKADPTVKSSCSVVLTEGDVKHVQCPFTDQQAVPRSINPGSDLTMVLEADILNAQVNSSAASSMQVSLTNYSDSEQTAFGGGTFLGAPVDASHLMWVDSEVGSSKIYFWSDFAETTVNSTLYGGASGSSSSSSSVGACTPACTGTDICIDGECVPQSGSGSSTQLRVSIDGPASQNYTPTTDDANLGTLTFGAENGNVYLQAFHVMIHSQQSLIGGGNGSDTDNVREVLENVEAFNPVTGQTMQGILRTGSAPNTQATNPSYDIWQFGPNYIEIAEGEESVWQIRADFKSNGAGKSPKAGDAFRIVICAEQNDQSEGCTFTVLSQNLTDYGVFAFSLPDVDYIPVLPGGSVAGNYHDISESGLTVTVKPQATTDSAVKNQNNVNLLRFEARASDSKDLLLTDLIFEAATATSLTNANNYTLWVDSDGDGSVDTVLETGKSNQSNAVTFDQLTGGGWVIPKNATVVFEVHADIAASFTEPNPILALRFDTGATFVSAEMVDNGSSLSGIQYTNLAGTTSVIGGGCTANVSCNIKVTTANATRYTLRNSGDLFVTQSSTPVPSRQLLGGTLERPISRINLWASEESIRVTRLAFTHDEFFGTPQLGHNLERLELFKVGETVPFAIASQGNCSSAAGQANYWMCASMNGNELVIPANEDIDILVRPRVKIDSNGSTKGANVTVNISDDPAAVLAYGVSSSVELPANNGNGILEGELFVGHANANDINRVIPGNPNYVVHSKVTTITNDDPNADGTVVSAGNDRAIGQFKFTAADHINTRDGLNDWHLYGIIFNVNATNVLLGTGDQRNPATSDFMLYNKADATTKVPCTANRASASGASLLVTCTDLIDLPVNSSIDAGESVTFVLEADVVNAKISSTASSVLQTSFTQYSNQDATTFGATASHVRWVDDDNGTDAVFHWIDYPETTINSTRYVN